jgi:hypothetical protein
MRDHFSRCIAMDKFTEFDSEYMDIGPVTVNIVLEK